MEDEEGGLDDARRKGSRRCAALGLGGLWALGVPETLDRTHA
jgi:hypothetical protein